jgi:hypothetical protein
VISVIKTVFPNFPVWILVGSMLSENHVIDKLTIFEKLLASWITVARIEKILCAKVVCQIAVVSEFPTFGLVFIAFLASG